MEGASDRHNRGRCRKDGSAASPVGAARGPGRQLQALHRLQQACIAAITATAGQQRGLAHVAFAVDAEAQRGGVAAGRDLRVVTERRTQALLQVTVATPTLGLGEFSTNIGAGRQGVPRRSTTRCSPITSASIPESCNSSRSAGSGGRLACSG